MLQLHKILIGLVIVGFFAVAITTFLSSGAVTYGKSTENTTMFNETFNKMTDLNTQIESFKEQESQEVDSSISDIVGGFFSNMYQSAKVLRGSVEVVGDMTDSTMDVLPAGSNASYLKTATVMIMTIVIFIGIFLAFVTGSERT